MKNRIKVYNLICGPVVKGAEGNKSVNTIRLWGKARKHKKNSIYLIGRVKNRYDNVYKQLKMHKLNEKDDYTCMLRFDKLVEDTVYDYQLGYIIGEHLLNEFDLDWSLIQTKSFKTDSPKHNPSFVFGSCRRYIDIAGMHFCGAGKSGDRIYNSINNLHPDFFLSIGDQVYFDPMNDFMRAKTLKDMRKLYTKVRNFPHIRVLMANTPTYEICDDHDNHCNNSNYNTRTREPNVYANAQKAYLEYQYYKEVSDINNYWYTFNRGNATFFVFDVRNERDERHDIIISDAQFKAFSNWINDKQNKYKIKFVVSSVPFISQNTDDSWYGFPKQQKEVLKLVLSKVNVYLLTGDAHCARSGKYKIIDKNEAFIGCITEILSSGLVAISHDQGKSYREGINIDEYNEDNDFPHTIDNTDRGGLKIVTISASGCYPNPSKPANALDAIRFPFERVVDNVFVQIVVKDKEMDSIIYNQDGILLEKTTHLLL